MKRSAPCSAETRPNHGMGTCLEQRAAQGAKMNFNYQTRRILQIFFATITTVFTQDLSSKELTDSKSPVPFPVFLPVNYEVRDADYLFLKEAGQDFMRNSSMQSHTQPFVILRASRQPAVNASYSTMSTEKLVPLDLVQSVQLFNAPKVFTFNWKIQAFVLTPRVFSSKPKVRVLFYVAGRDWGRGAGTVDELPCVKVYAFWQTQEVRGSCVMGGDRGTCMAELAPALGWFAVGSETSRERQGPTTGNPVELYYQAQPKVNGKCNSVDGSRWGGSQQQAAEFVPFTPMQRIGSVRLLQVPKGMATLSRLKLGNAIVIRTSSKPLKKTDISTFYILMASSAQLTNFTLRATVKKGVTFRTATPSNSLLWDITVDMGADGAIAVICQKKAPIPGKRLESSLLEVLQMDFEVEELSSPLDSQVIIWRLELPSESKDVVKTEGAMRIFTTQRDFVGLAPLVMDTEILNTAVLTGKKVVMPVRTVAVEEDGVVTDVSDYTDCSSGDEDVLKVSDRCNYVFLNGKETKGKVKLVVNFTYSYLSAQLELNVWMPRLPLQIEVSDTELSQIKSWRVPILASKRTGWNSEEDRKGKGCMLQFQHALVRVLTHFVAEQADPRDPKAYFLGSDWQVDVTRLVRYFIKVEDPRVARLQAGRVLSGRDLGTTTIQVFSPLSDAILAKTTIKVVDDKVTITDLGVQLVTGLSMTLQLSTGSNRAILATTSTQEFLQTPKQEALVSAWVQFSDGNQTPLDIYDPAFYRVTVTSLDPGVVSVQGPLPTVVAEGEGEGVLVRVEISICESCQKSKRKSTVAVGNGSLKVKFQVNSRRPGGNYSNTFSTKDNGSDYGNDGEEVDSERKQREQSNGPPPRSSTLDREESVMQKITTTIKSTERTFITSGSLGGVGKTSNSGNPGSPTSLENISMMNSPSDGSKADSSDNMIVEDMSSVSTVKAPGNLVNYNFPTKVEVSGQETEEVETGAEEMLVNRPLTDLEIGMYALLGVFCLAILVFLVNCISYVVKFRHKKPPSHGQEPTGHRHDWVWLGTDAELVMSVPGSPVQQDSQTATTVIDIGPDKTCSLPRRPSCLASVTDSPLSCVGSLRSKPMHTESLHSPTSKRKRVQFTTFSTLERQHSPHLPPRENGYGIHWVGKQDSCEEEAQVPMTDTGDQL
ncbi:LOW QUALITY PROTEIN: transmembrane protein 132D [Cyclopterus lumpus]|uniref:LOW QUALITY PROTEIN: transmembrane protein 132D n=1 Tax=Cyclopterus lumpus TaxID=8103 RepID=UPI001486F02B|nr:LOW QUALITY PROTEIN: transmembrane protein 132D [Cyclopterus lumpus]